MRALGIDWAGTRLMLCAERALFWPDGGTLFVADLHLGKSAYFQQHGLALPDGHDARDLERLSDLLARYRARHLAILGDLMHAAPADRAGWVDRLLCWRARHHDIAMTLIVGNHDRAPSRLRPAFDTHAEPLIHGPFRLHHHPTATEDGYVLCGHVHPAVRVGDRIARRRFPAFWLRRRCLVLPAFGGATGTHLVQPSPGDRLYAVLPDGILALDRVPLARSPRPRATGTPGSGAMPPGEEA